VKNCCDPLSSPICLISSTKISPCFARIKLPGLVDQRRCQQLVVVSIFSLRVDVLRYEHFEVDIICKKWVTAVLKFLSIIVHDFVYHISITDCKSFLKNFFIQDYREYVYNNHQTNMLKWPSISMKCLRYVHIS
jgi:hypothetical protein